MVSDTYPVHFYTHFLQCARTYSVPLQMQMNKEALIYKFILTMNGPNPILSEAVEQDYTSMHLYIVRSILF